MVVDMARQGDLKKAESLVGNGIPLRKVVDYLNRWPKIA
jgi:hypothetical protein